MSDESTELVRRRLLAVLEKRRPDIDDDDRESLVDAVCEFVDLDGDLTHFWKGVYGVESIS